jgi:hypothetical protein
LIRSIGNQFSGFRFVERFENAEAFTRYDRPANHVQFAENLMMTIVVSRHAVSANGDRTVCDKAKDCGAKVRFHKERIVVLCSPLSREIARMLTPSSISAMKV